MAIRKVRPGERIKAFPAEAYNGLVDLLGKPASAPAADSGDAYGDRRDYWIVITGNTVVTANAKWEYDCKIMFDDATSTAWGGGTQGANTFKARNTWEDVSRVGAKAGYASATVTALLPIPTNAVVRGTLTTISGATFFRFSERNEPTC